MSITINAYFDPAENLGLEELRRKKVRILESTEGPRTKPRYFIPLRFKDGLPAEALEIKFDGFTLLAKFQMSPHRAKGKYKLMDAFGLLDVEIAQTNYYRLEIVGEELGSVKVLYELIRLGHIAPSESWEGPQVTSTPMERK